MFLKYFRITLCAIFTAFFSTIWSIICLFRPAHPANTFGIARIVGYIGRYILGIKVEIENLELLNQSSSSVIISNHQSNYDMFYVGQICPKKTVSVGKKSILYVPFFGIMYWLSGNILIDRKNRTKAWNVMDKVVEQIQRYSCNIWIMPEGTRSKGRGVLPFKKGAFLTAIKGKFPVICVCTSTFDKSIDLSRWNAGVMKIKVLPKIETNSLTQQDIESFTQKVHAIVKFEVARLDTEIGSRNA